MKDVLIKDDVVAILRKMAQDLPKQADLLRELDAAIGDGDLGITITIGFEAVVDALPGRVGRPGGQTDHDHDENDSP